ncbi:SMI1_KNR4 domain containing protein [Flavobacterium anhuiense]|uniref:SMI1_KNR4 domain containing protein n=1 Tax=Flavobacterium anhuiense TaxID=459526 RepID=A0A444VWS3_9FLAO|nr:SMI1/KNR4 family protein [Flavobacterium anhuiense]RYJ38031.1 SMI1_KNR4 domain containing protein [Flavobacterium anhuiense]
MKLILEESEQKLTIKEISEFEKLFNCSLPNSFKEFYLLNNGGHYTEENQNRFILGGFNSIKYGDLPIEKLYTDLIEDFNKLSQMIPFAYDYGGNCFLLSLKKEDYNSIFLWLMDEKELVFVSRSFDLFISDLKNDCKG